MEPNLQDGNQFHLLPHLTVTRMVVILPCERGVLLGEQSPTLAQCLAHSSQPYLSLIDSQGSPALTPP